MLSRSSFFLFFCATSLVAAASQKCHDLNGSELDDTFAPCNSSAEHSGCCATNKTTGADICLDNGLCMATKSEYMGTIWQTGCTDSTGKATECPQLCPGGTSRSLNLLSRHSLLTTFTAHNDFDGLNPVSAWNIQACDFGTYCCRAINDRKSCCNNSIAPRFTTSSIGALQLQTAAAASATHLKPTLTTPDPAPSSKPSAPPS